MYINKYFNSFRLCFFIIILLLVGCQTTNNQFNHLSPVMGTYNTISTSINYNHDIDFNNYRKFAIIDPLVRSSQNQLNGVSGNAVKYIISEALEHLGYVPVSEQEEPDMLITVSGRVVSETVKMSGGSGILPIWKPGETYTYTGSSSTSFNAYSATGTSYRGNLYGTEYGTVDSSGSTDYISYKKPDYTVQNNYAQLLVVAYDYKSKKELVLVRSSAQTNSPDPSLAIQYITDVMYEFPRNEKEIKKLKERIKWKAQEGLLWASRSINGADLYPVAFYVLPTSPAAKAGVKAGDIVISANGYDTKNVPTSKLVRDVDVNVGDILNLIVLREGNKIYKFDMKTISFDDFKKLYEKQIGTSYDY